MKLAIESRSRFEDMPTEREMIRLQEHFADNPWVGYWHDFGHVQLKHNLGLLDHVEWLERISPHLIGGHVHDVEWPARDHRVPFGGTLDYAPLAEVFPARLPADLGTQPHPRSHRNPQRPRPLENRVPRAVMIGSGQSKAL